MRFGVCFFGIALLTASAWLIRNFVLLGDPIYPLATSFLHDKGIITPVFRATETQVKETALSYWGAGVSAPPFIRQVWSAFWDRILIPIGALPALAAIGFSWKRRGPIRLIGVAIVVWFVVVLAPGWFFMRSLVPMCPLIAIGGGYALARVIPSIPHRRSNGAPDNKTAAGGVRIWVLLALAVAIIVTSSVVSAAIAIAAPNQVSGTLQLEPTGDALIGVHDLGSTSATLWTARARRPPRVGLGERTPPTRRSARHP